MNLPSVFGTSILCRQSPRLFTMARLFTMVRSTVRAGQHVLFRGYGFLTGQLWVSSFKAASYGPPFGLWASAPHITTSTCTIVTRWADESVAWLLTCGC